MGSECIITPICGVTCGENCPAFDFDSNPIPCRVMSAAIRAFRAQEEYWKNKE